MVVAEQSLAYDGVESQFENRQLVSARLAFLAGGHPTG